jgi:hypothetical protein
MDAIFLLEQRKRECFMKALNDSDVKRFLALNITRFFGVTLTVAMLGGAAASAQAAQTTQVTAPEAVSTSQPPDSSSDWVMALIAPPLSQPAAAAPQPIQEPKKLPLADFGQWDEAASEN